MTPITLVQPKQISFGNGCLTKFIQYFISLGYKHLYLLTTPEVYPLIQQSVKTISDSGIAITIDDSIVKEPTVQMFNHTLHEARQSEIDSVVGIGGGSVLDVAKLVAALINRKQSLDEIYGIGKLSGRETYLACLPTTSGTGSEVSPNSILLDENDRLKKGIISPYLVPDAAFIDPLLTLTLPPKLTASTGIDALTHCIEAYANKFAHPIVDTYALKGIELIGQNLMSAFNNGADESARAKMSLASLYGGLCLGPVNTAAVHALAYPLGSAFNVAHGISNAVLLPFVMRFNLSSAPKRYANIAKALGVEIATSVEETALRGINRITQLLLDCNIPTRLSQLNISSEDIENMASSAMTVTRLLKNNLKEVTLEDAVTIYKEAY
jgi:alcohol dehydrogenase class IV